ncbi:MAG: Hpt domain-containing protein, partial [Gaiellaceae bacterium]
LDAGMNDYIAKPIRVDELVAAIKRTPRRAAKETAPDVVNGPIDAGVLTRLAESMGGDTGFVLELIEQFRADSLGLIAAARAGVERSDMAEVRRAAHTLKSNAATFGAHHLADRCRELEEAAKQGSLDEGASQVDALGEELELVRSSLPVLWREMTENGARSHRDGTHRP